MARGRPGGTQFTERGLQSASFGEEESPDTDYSSRPNTAGTTTPYHTMRQRTEDSYTLALVCQ